MVFVSAVWSIPTAIMIIAVVSVGLFLLLAKFWTKVVRGLALYGTAPLTNLIETYDEWSQYLKWQPGSLLKVAVHIAKCFWPPIAYWDSMLAEQFWWGCAGILLWGIFTYSIAGHAVRRWYQLKTRKYRFFARGFIVLVLMLTLGGALPNTWHILVPKMFSIITSYMGHHPKMTIIVSIIFLLPSIMSLVWGLRAKEVWVREKRDTSTTASKKPSQTTERLKRKLEELPHLSKQEKRDYEDGMKQYWNQKLEYPNAGILLNDLEVNGVSTGSVRGILHTEKGIGEVIRTESGKFIIYL